VGLNCSQATSTLRVTLGAIRRLSVIVECASLQFWRKILWINNGGIFDDWYNIHKSVEACK
jgi:hypothetical protein